MRIVLIALAALLIAAGAETSGSLPFRLGPTVFYGIPPVSYRSGTFFGAVDTNGDGFSDLVVLGPGGETVSVFLGDGSGKLHDRIDSDIGGIVYASGNAAIADFDSDGHPDLVIAMNKGPLRLLLGDGHGRFVPGPSLERVGPNPDCPGPIVAADLNRDGKLDILANQCQGGLGVFLGTAGGTFRMAGVVKVSGLSHSVDQSMSVGDFNGDGVPDVAVGTLTGIAVLLGKGDGTFQDQVMLETGPPMKLVVADVNCDGKPDLIVMPADPEVRPAPMFGIAGNNIVVYLGDGKGGFKALPPFSALLSNFPTDGGFPNHIEITDVTQDKVPDLIITKQQFSYKTNEPDVGLLVFSGRGDGSFRRVAEFRNTRTISKYPRFTFALMDLNGDQLPDLVFLNDRTGAQIGIAVNGAKHKGASLR